jgi:hypothetical protein
MVSYINASPLEFVKTLTGSTENFRYNISFNDELEAEENAQEQHVENLDDTLGADTIKSKVSVFSAYSNFHQAPLVEGREKDDKFIIFFDQLKDRYII